VRTIIFLACLGGAYALLHDGFGIDNQAVAGLLAWPVGFAAYFLITRVALRLPHAEE